MEGEDNYIPFRSSITVERNEIFVVLDDVIKSCLFFAFPDYVRIDPRPRKRSGFVTSGELVRRLGLQELRDVPHFLDGKQLRWTIAKIRANVLTTHNDFGCKRTIRLRTSRKQEMNAMPCFVQIDRVLLWRSQNGLHQEFLIRL